MDNIENREVNTNFRLIDDRKIPEAYYGIALCYLKTNSFEEVEKYYKMGVQKGNRKRYGQLLNEIDFLIVLLEPDQLPFFQRESENGKILQELLEGKLARMLKNRKSQNIQQKIPQNQSKSLVEVSFYFSWIKS